MQITFCAYDAPKLIDGPSAWLKRLLPFLRQQGIETRLLFLANKVSNLSMMPYFQGLGYACKLVPAELFFEEQMQMIMKDIRDFPPDVFVPNYFAVAGYVNCYTRKAGIPSLMILHNDDPFHRALVDVFGRGSKAFAVSALVPVSRQMEQNMLAGIHALVQCIPYGAPVPDRSTSRVNSQKLKLIYLGRLNNHQKRITDVAKAFCRVTREVPDTEAVIYGNGPELQKVLQIISTEGKDAHVTYGGALDMKEAQEKLLENHVYVLLSKYEGIPIALMEAMACGLVPICSDIESGIPELVTTDETGIIVANSEDAFLKAVQQLAVDRTKWSRLSAAARKKIENGFAVDVCNARWLELLKLLAAQNTYQGDLAVPSLKELRKVEVRREFLVTETRMPAAVLVPAYRLKKKVGQLKRNYLN